MESQLNAGYMQREYKSMSPNDREKLYLKGLKLQGYSIDKDKNQKTFTNKYNSPDPRSEQFKK